MSGLNTSKQRLIDIDTELEELIKHAFKDEKKEDNLWDYVAVVVISGASVIVYVEPSLELAGDKLWKKILYPAGSLVANFFLNAWATKEFIDEYKCSREKRSSFFARFGLAQFPAALSTFIYWNNSNDKVGKKITFALLIQVGTGILMTRAVNSAGIIAQQVKSLRPTAEDELRNTLLARLRSARKEILAVEHFPSEIKSSSGDIQQLLDILAKATDKQAESNWQLFSKKVTGFVGSCLASCTWVGTIVNAQNQFNEWLPVWPKGITGIITGVFSVLPVTLALYGGYIQFGMIVSLLVSLYQRQFIEPHYALQRHPRLTISLVGLALTFTAFSFPTQVYLIEKYFSGTAQQVLKVFAGMGTVIFNSLGAPSFISNAIRAWSERFGNSDEKDFAVFDCQMSRLIHELKNLDSLTLAEDCRLLSENDQQRLLGDQYKNIIGRTRSVLKEDNNDEGREPHTSSPSSVFNSSSSFYHHKTPPLTASVHKTTSYPVEARTRIHSP